MQSNETTIHSWDELQSQLFQGSWQPGLDRFRSPFVFRGALDASFKLETSLIRLNGNIHEMEHHLLRNFRKYSLRSVVEQDTIWHWLSLAQHHGLPTRLMDWTLSPMVAAHFATADISTFAQDGAIWVVDQGKAHNLLPEPLRNELTQEGADFFTVEMLSHVVDSLTALDQLSPPPFVIFFEPPSIDDRIVNQYAIFSIMSGPELSLETWLSDHSDLWRKIIIPAGIKWEIRDKLDQSNITERVLFPGLDGLSRWLRRYYSPKNG